MWIRNCPKKPPYGFSLLELMVSMLLLGLALSGIWQVYLQSRISNDIVARVHIQRLAEDFAEMAWYSDITTQTGQHYNQWRQRLEQQLGIPTGASKDLVITVERNTRSPDAQTIYWTPPLSGELRISWLDAHTQQQRLLRQEWGR